MTTMRAILPGPEMVWAQTERPEPGPGQIRIRVAATAVNRADLVQQAGRYPPPPGASQILGLECAGTIDAVGPDVSPSRVGEQVAALLSGGGYAEFAICHAEHTLPLHPHQGATVAAAIPETLCTAFLNLKVEAALEPGERVLLHAGGSGVGTTAIELCRQWGNPTWVTVGSNEKVAQCVAIGADGGSNRHTDDWVEQAREWSEGRGIDVILDPVGGGYLGPNQQALATDGRMVLIGLMGGRADQLDLGRLLIKRQRIIGSTLRARSDAFKAALIDRIRDEAWSLYDGGLVVPQIHAVLPLSEAREAHDLLASNATFGKVVLSVDP